MQRRRPGNPNAPRLPLQRSVDALTPDDNGSIDGMGDREDTTLIPLRRGEVRVPTIRPPVIMGRWASVTQTGEIFPSEFSEGAIASPQSHHHDDDGGGLEAMEKHVSNMLLDDDDAGAPDTTTTPVSTPMSNNAAKLPDANAPVPSAAPSTKPNVGGALLKRISDHHPMFLFPPPPPPAANADCYQYLSAAAAIPPAAPTTNGQGPSSQHWQQLQVYSPLMRKKLMRWYQIVELWCIERAVQADGTFVIVLDRERAIVAPPPRPPMFSEEVAPQLLQRHHDATTARPHAPYNVERWASSCSGWWERVMVCFDKLRNESEFAGMQHVAKGKVSKVWAAADVARLIA